MAKRYTASKKTYEPRPQAALLTYSLAEKKVRPSLVDPYDEVGPGLYPDESVYTLDTGEDVAISVKPQWAPNGAGVTLYVWGRWINEDGSTKLDVDGQEVEVAYTHGFNTAAIEEHGLSLLMKEMLLLVLGEEAEAELEVPTDKDTPDKIKVLHAPQDVRLGASIRHAIKHVKEAGDLKLPADLLE
jgi:hypothetical protein